jgi:hypothetical protein
MNKEIITDPQKIRQLIDDELLQEDRKKLQEVNKPKVKKMRRINARGFKENNRTLRDK